MFKVWAILPTAEARLICHFKGTCHKTPTTYSLCSLKNGKLQDFLGNSSSPSPAPPPHQMLILCKACITNAKVPILGTLFLTFASIQQRCDYKGSVNSCLHYFAHLSRLDWFNMEMFDFFPRLSRLLKMNNFFRSEEGPKGRHSRPGSWRPESFVPDTHLSRWCRVTPRPPSGFELEEDCFAMLCWAQVSHMHTYTCIGVKCVCVYPFPLGASLPSPTP